MFHYIIGKIDNCCFFWYGPFLTSNATAAPSFNHRLFPPLRSKPDTSLRFLPSFCTSTSVLWFHHWGTHSAFSLLSSCLLYFIFHEFVPVCVLNPSTTFLNNIVSKLLSSLSHFYWFVTRQLGVPSDGGRKGFLLSVIVAVLWKTPITPCINRSISSAFLLFCRSTHWLGFGFHWDLSLFHFWWYWFTVIKALC